MSQLNYLGIGEAVPNVRFPVRAGDAWRDLTTEEIFADKTVVVFALPGAFTPTCSSSHLPGYATYAREIKAAGVDEIYCLSVNDWFVMDAWRQGLGIKDEVLMLPDGNADFTTAMGMLVKKRHLGFGERSWRYAMIIHDGVIDTLFVEDISDTGDPFSVSGASEMLEHLKRAAAAE